MTKVRTWAGLDVHAAATVACVVDAPSGEMSVHRLAGRTSEVTAFCGRLPAPVRVAYEAGPTGFELARALDAAGVACVVAAPGKIERPAQDRVKTDRRDAERLVRLLMIGGLHPVRVPSTEEEALRDLVRAREDLRGDLMRARHRLSKLLLRHDVRYDDTASAWTAAHRAWLARLELGERAAPPPSTAQARHGGKARSPSPAPATPAGCSSRPPGTTAARHAQARRSNAASKTSPPRRSRSPGKRSSASTSSGGDSTANAASARRSSQSPSPATSPASAGRLRGPTPTRDRTDLHASAEESDRASRT